MQVKFVTVNNVLTRYYEAGEGDPVLMIHGIGSSADVWIRNVDALSSKFRVIALDLLGHGLTEAGRYDGGAPQPAMVEHIVAFIDELGLRRLSICGSSYGAMITLFTYFQIKHRVDRLVLISSASATLAPAERLRAVETAYANSVAAYDEPSLAMTVDRMRRLFHDPARIPADVTLIQLNLFSRPGMRQNFEVFMRGLMEPEANLKWRVDNRFAEIEVPLLMVWGEKDGTVDAKHALDLARQVREAYFVEASGCGHVPHLERPEIVNPVMEAFLTGASLQQYRVQSPKPSP